LLDAARLGKVVGNQLWRDCCRKMSFKRIGDVGVMQLSAAFQ
jgi:hypothetical protein